MIHHNDSLAASAWLGKVAQHFSFFERKHFERVFVLVDL